jgi:hypothetical protein
MLLPRRSPQFHNAPLQRLSQVHSHLNSAAAFGSYLPGSLKNAIGEHNRVVTIFDYFFIDNVTTFFILYDHCLTPERVLNDDFRRD